MKNIKNKKPTTAARMGKLFVIALVFALLFAALSSLTGVSAKNAKNEYAFDGVHITRTSVAIKVGGSYKLSFRKLNAPSADEVWTSADPSVATVKDAW